MPKDYQFDDLLQAGREARSTTVSLSDDPSIEDDDKAGSETEPNPDKRITSADLPDDDLFEDLTPRHERPAPTVKGESDDEDDEKVDDEGDEPAARDSEGDDASYSKKVRDRIARERRLRLKERQERDAENAELRERLDRIERETAKREAAAALADIDEKLSAVKQELVAAKEAGDTAKEVELTDKLTDLKAEKVLKKQQIESDSATATRRDGGDKPAVQPRLAREWLKKNGRYHSDLEFQEIVKSLDKMIAREGFDVNAQEYYDELDKRLAKYFPDHNKAARKPQARNTNRPGPQTRGNEGLQRRQNESRNRVEITARDKDLLRRLGLDPTDPNVLKEHARNKAASRLAQG